MFFLFSIIFILVSALPCQAKETDLKYRLKWKFNASVAGVIYADANGFFTQQGLNVTTKEGGPEKNPITELELKQADFGVASADQVIYALNKGAQIVVIAQLFQINPMQWIYRSDKPRIKSLADLKGRTIGITFGGNDEGIMNTLFATAGITKDDVTITGAGFNHTPFLTKKVDVWPVYRNSQGVHLKDQLAKAGEGVYFFNPADFGVNFVANSVITSKNMIKNNPEIVDKFLKALLKGWKEAMNPANEAKAIAAIKDMDKGNSNPEIIQKQLTATRKLIKPSPSVKIGTINVKDWKQTEQIMLKEKQIKKAVYIENFLIPIK
jgi:NitT/TauT family transport system substrate-binding protein